MKPISEVVYKITKEQSKHLAKHYKRNVNVSNFRGYFEYLNFKEDSKYWIKQCYQYINVLGKAKCSELLVKINESIYKGTYFETLESIIIPNLLKVIREDKIDEIANMG